MIDQSELLRLLRSGCAKTPHQLRAAREIVRLRSALARVADELSDPSGKYWCQKKVKDRFLLEHLLDFVVGVIGGDDE